MTVASFLAQAAPWALPPLLGAGIGYLTNSVAIRMLFRPLRPWRVLGVRVPFTPGVIPRQRHDLADRIGRMVSSDLLTEEVFTARFADPRFAGGLQRMAVATVDEFAALTVADVRARFSVDRVLDVVHGAIAAAAADGVLHDVVASILAARATTIADAVAAAADRLRPLALMPTELRREVLEGVWERIPPAIDPLLEEPAVRSSMETAARAILRETLDQLSGFQRFVVTAAQYDRQLEERIPRIVDRAVAEIRRLVREPQTQATLSVRILRWMETNESRSLEELFGDGVAHRLGEAVAAALHDGDRARALADGLVPPNAADHVVAAARAWLTGAGERRVGDVVPVLRRRRATIGAGIARTATQALTRYAPRFVAEMNVYQVVVDRIDALDIERVEGLLLGIIRRHLRWINLFGALLGALIGGVQLLLPLFGL